MERVPVISSAHSWRDALEMRAVRNEVAEFMTGNSNRLGLVEQFNWFFTTYRRGRQDGSMEGFVVRLNGKPVGYGLIREMDGKPWVTGAIRQKWRGLGFGRQLFEHLTIRASQYGHRDVWLDVLQSNDRAIQLYQSLGYTPVAYQGDRTITMRWTP